MNKATTRNYILSLIIAGATALLFLCVLHSFDALQEKPGLYPGDHLLAQRSFPYNDIDISAYRQALKSMTDGVYKIDPAFDEQWTPYGPLNISGRITDIEISPADPFKIYAGSASGGVLYSGDGGINWQNIFDEQATQSVGDIAISTLDPNLIVVSTGEANGGGGSIAYDGLGIYLSMNGGASWENKGLTDAGSIAKVAIHPHSDSVIYAAAMGSLFRNNPERGVYKTEDMGLNWKQVLSISDSTGAIDLVLHPDDPDTLYAALWERVRRPAYLHYGGQTSGIYRSFDGGKNWVMLSDSLPSNPVNKGRIGLAISKSAPHILYAYYANSDGSLNGIYRSEDNGDSWEERSVDGISAVNFMWWFGRIYVDPQNPDKLYATSLHMAVSEDGANSWQQIFPEAHVDHHALAIDPANTDRIYNGNDGGINQSLDGGMSSFNNNGLNNIQFYTCEIDPSNPDRIYGGAQDNGTLMTEGNADGWRNIFGGDGFRVLVDPADSQQIYVEAQYGFIFASENGGKNFYDARSGLSGNFNWNTPIAMDPLNSEILYTGAQRLFRSSDKGMSWQSISEPLTGPVTPQGNLNFGSLTAIDISSVNNEIIYAGSDRGEIWISRDRGVSYENIIGGLPERWITSIAHDPFDEAGVYVSISGFRFGEHNSQVYYSPDFGTNWMDIASALPDVPVNDIIVDDVTRGTLYVATDVGVFVSTNNGADWSKMGEGLEILPFLDLDYDRNSRILIAASYGRGIYRYELAEPSSVVNQQIFQTELYPNPARDELYIKAEVMASHLKVYSPTGALVKSIPQGNRIDLAGLDPGMYLLSFIQNEKKYICRFIKL